MKQYIVDAFTDKLFHGNQAAICILDTWLSEKLMMNITRENNFSETAFAVKENGKYHLRWFTPGGEIDLCGHATLACAFVILNFYSQNADTVTFTTLSGDLTVTRKDDLYEMEFPIYKLVPVKISSDITDALGAEPKEVYLGRDMLCVFDKEDAVTNMNPDMEKVKLLDGAMLHITAKGKEYDCVSRSFAPKVNVTEDPVCGSGHCHIASYWSEKLHKNKITAYQASKRSGILYCNVENDKIYISGKAVLFSISELNL